MTVRDALREGAAALSGTETPFLDASLLLADALSTDGTRLLASGPEIVEEGPLARYRRGLASRSHGLPLAYIVGYKEFWGRRFSVDPRVLVPRPDTETLVEAALKLGDAILRERGQRANDDYHTEMAESTEITEEENLGGWKGGDEGPSPSFSSFPSSRIPSYLFSPCPPYLRDLRAESPSRSLRLRVHECCTGSGCVAISVAADRPEWSVSASDLSEGALEVARANSRAHVDPARPGGPLAFVRSDLLSSLSRGAIGASRGPFDLILANPPYVGSVQTDALLALGWSEPRMALDGGMDGLDLVRRLVPEAARALSMGGALLVEADGDQAAEVAALFRASRLTDIETDRDLGGKARVTSGRKQWTA
jgi:release factor glutamine methyltransferase